MTHLALLRGINVGGKNLIPMRALATLFAEAGGGDVRTYIQSGNVIFEAAPNEAEKLVQSVATAIAAQFRCQIPIVVRTADQLSAVLENNPFLQGTAPAETTAEMLHVYLLAHRPAPEKVATLDAARSLPDTFVVQGSEIYLRMPNGMGRTKLTNAYFDSKLSTVSTARNWRTLQKLCELMG